MTTTGKVTSDGLHLRATPNGKIVDAIDKGDKVDVLGRVTQGKHEWLHVRATRQSETGWVAARFVEMDPEPAPPPDIEPTCEIEPEDAPSRTMVSVIAGLVVGGIVVLMILLRHS